MRPPFRYYGSKVRMAKLIISLMPAHRVYVEPFAGSLSVLFAKDPVAHEVVNDLNSDVVRFLRVLRDHPAELARLCRLTPHSRAEFELASQPQGGGDVSELELARRFWVRVNQGFNGLQVRAGWSSSITQNTNRAVTVARVADRLLECAERLRGVTIECRPAVDVIGRYGVAGAVLYLDPPYLESTRSARAKRPAGDYVHEMSDADHEALAEALHRTPATVLLSGYRSSFYDELYGDFDALSVAIDRPSTRGSSVGVSGAVETIWSNRPIGARAVTELAV